MSDSLRSQYSNWHYINIANQFKMHNLNFPNTETIIRGLQSDKQEIQTIREQSKIVYLLEQKINKRDAEIQELQKAVFKYKKYYDEYELIKANLSTKSQEVDRLKQENKILYSEVDKVVREAKQYQQKLLLAQKQKHEFIKQRNGSDKRFRDIQETYEEYQESCKSREKDLLMDLQKAYKQIKQLNNKIDDLQKVHLENQQLKNKLLKNQSLHATNFDTSKSNPDYINMSLQYPLKPNQNMSRVYGTQSYQFSGNRSHKKHSRDKDNEIEPQLAFEIDNLKKQLLAKEEQLQRAKALTHQLSIEFDKSVSKICEFEKELTAYRKENHELKKTLSLFVERQQYEKMHKNKIANRQSSEQSQEYSESENQIGYSHFTSSERAF